MTSRIKPKIAHYLITSIIIIGFGYLPPISPITQEGMIILGVFIGCVYGWSTIDMIFPSILGILRLGIHSGMGTILSAGLGSPTVWMVIMFFVAIGILNDLGIIEFIAYFFMSRKIVQGRPWLLITLLTFGVYIASIFNGFAALIIFWGILFKICEILNIKPYTKFPTVIALIFLISSVLALISVPFASNALIALGAFTPLTGIEISFLKYALTSIPIGVFSILCAILIARFILKVPVAALKEVNLSTLNPEKKTLDKKQKLTLLMFLWIIIDLFAASILPDCGIKVLLTNLTIFGQATLPIVVFSFIRIDHEPLFDIRQTLTKHVSWDVIILMGVIFPLIQLLTADSTGVSQFFSNLVTPLSSLGTVGFLILITAIVALLTNFANNSVLVIICLPLIYSFSQQSSMNPVAAMFILLYAAHFSILTPAACPNTALYFSNTNWIDMKTSAKYASVFIVLLWLFTSIFGYFWANLLWQ